MDTDDRTPEEASEEPPNTENVAESPSQPFSSAKTPKGEKESNEPSSQSTNPDPTSPSQTPSPTSPSQTAGGDISKTSSDQADPEATPRPRVEVDIAAIDQRLRRRPDWAAVRDTKASLEEAARGTEHLRTKAARKSWVYSELDRIYPESTEEPAPHDETNSPQRGGSHETPGKTPGKTSASGIEGLAKFPDDWPDLPANAPISKEIAWVQANRLLVVAEKPSGATVVTLGLARSPAPSLSAIGWLETAIRSYAKFVDVASKLSGGDDDDNAQTRAERLRIAEMEELLGEMLDPQAD